VALLLPLALAGCGSETQGVPGGEERHPYAGIGAGERLRFAGTEPYWSGEVAGSSLTYGTSQNRRGTAIPVERFAGRNGVSWAGTLEGAPFVLAAAEAPCSDGMSGRTYPFTITLQLGAATRGGCGWTDARPFAGPAAP